MQPRYSRLSSWSTYKADSKQLGQRKRWICFIWHQLAISHRSSETKTHFVYKWKKLSGLLYTGTEILVITDSLLSGQRQRLWHIYRELVRLEILIKVVMGCSGGMESAMKELASHIFFLIDLYIYGVEILCPEWGYIYIPPAQL